MTINVTIIYSSWCTLIYNHMVMGKGIVGAMETEMAEINMNK